ncbi:hypothetical protein QE411_001566 [Microbacterium arborescens]|nr:hypothetical protein [Microbacterium arborescens]RKE63627.1 hypothetical protein DEU36_0838 [Microbacterium sp. AG238]
MFTELFMFTGEMRPAGPIMRELCRLLGICK